MTNTLFYFIQNSIVFIIAGWAIYLVYRIGKLYYMPVSTMAAGAYFVAYAMKELHWPWFLAAIIVILAGGIMSFILSPGLVRASSFGVVVVTIGMLFIFRTVIRNIPVLGGEWGFLGIPKVNHIMPISIVLLIIIGVLINRLDNSRIGRAIGVTFNSEEAAKTLGINIFWLSVSLQVISGALGGLAGALYAGSMSTLNVAAFSFDILLLLLIFVFVGGYTTMWGVAIATPILYGIPVILPSAIADWRYIVYGFILIFILIFKPTGLIDKDLVRKIRIFIFSLFKRKIPKNSN